MTKTGTGPVTLLELRLAGDLGSANSTSLAIETASDIRVGGDVLGNIALTNDSFVTGSFVFGNFLGNLTISAGSIINLPITGDFGSPSGSPVTVSVGGNILFLSAKSYNTNMTVNGSIDSMAATDTNAGDFLGSLVADELQDLDGNGDGLAFSGNVAGNINFNGDANLPITFGKITSPGGIKITGDLSNGVGTLRVLGRSTGTIRVDGTVRSQIAIDSCTGPIIVGVDITGGAGIAIEDTTTNTDSQAISIGQDCRGQIRIGSSADPDHDLRGSITIGRDLIGDLNVFGDIEGSITVGRNLSQSALIRVGGTLASGASVQIGNPSQSGDSLLGQVVIKARDIGGTWSGQVGVDNAVLSGPYYNLSSASLGGGAVGLAPFRVNVADAQITDGGYYFRPAPPQTGSLPKPFRIRHYGAFTIASTPKVWLQDPYNPSVWGDVSALFQMTAEPLPSGARHQRTLRVEYIGVNNMPMSPGRYRVSVAEEDLLCQNVTDGMTTFVTPYDFFFHVALDCDASGTPGASDYVTNFVDTTWNSSIDCDRNGVGDSWDLAFDGSFRDVLPAPGGNDILDACEISGPCPCDFNEDDVLNSQDFFDWILCFFSAC